METPQKDHAVHIRFPKDLYNKILRRLTKMRRTDPLANFSDALRDIVRRSAA